MNYVVTPQVAHELKAAGYLRKTRFVYVSRKAPNDFSPDFRASQWSLLLRVEHGVAQEIMPAPTQEELLKDIPGNIGGYYTTYQKGLLGNLFFGVIRKMSDNSEVVKAEAKTLTDVMGLVVAYITRYLKK